ncbi:hypothetical protein B5F77_08495 [Parabacteroides sp. An277]|uniref:hypothetical protein n=1 Tax=Parabacteroides sp. An277 TaxID=1965619 RepID=UPI000B399367|nr:hypothetical protein [Parabacteroides sp. An277]OUO52378.1 hypothetical protein B5F77_08495 [Parabacteroides sp. An277]
MEITAKVLYEGIKNRYEGIETTICQLHKPCSERRRCGAASVTPVLDFDAVERRFHAHADSPSPSVDAVAYSERNLFCFVEIKGWNEFLYNPHRPEPVSEQAIATQVRKYDLKGKLMNSMRICLDINSISSFGEVEVVFVVVTDIDVRTAPLESLAANLGMLATTSSRWEEVCNQYMQRVLHQTGDIRKWYISCRDWDTQWK